MTPELITGCTYRYNKDAKRLEVVCEYAYMACRATIWDAELVAWAEERERKVKARRTAAQSAEVARPGEVVGERLSSSAPAAGVS